MTTRCLTPLMLALAMFSLASCTTSLFGPRHKLPKPGEPTHSDIDERWQRKEQDLDRPLNDPREAYTDPAAKAAYDAGYSAGYLDRSRHETSDPEPRMSGTDLKHRSAFIAGYTAGYAK